MECLNQLTKEDIIQAVNEWIFNNSTRRAVFFMICSNQHVDAMKTYLQETTINNDTSSSSKFQFYNHQLLLTNDNNNNNNDDNNNNNNDTIKFNHLEDLTNAKSNLSYP